MFTKTDGTSALNSQTGNIPSSPANKGARLESKNVCVSQVKVSITEKWMEILKLGHKPWSHSNFLWGVKQELLPAQGLGERSKGWLKAETCSSWVPSSAEELWELQPGHRAAP